MGEAMSDVALSLVVGYVENSARMQAAHYREEVARFRSLEQIPVILQRSRRGGNSWRIPGR